jgi:hypothetical protein
MMRLVDQSARIERAAPKSSARGSRYPRHDPANADTGTLARQDNARGVADVSPIDRQPGAS